MTANPSVIEVPVPILPVVAIPGLTVEEACGLIFYLVNREGVSPRTVERRVQDTLTFLSQCGQPGKRLVPTRQVDKIWHAMILHTEWYGKLCAGLGRTFIHHQPNDFKTRGKRKTGRGVESSNSGSCELDCDLSCQCSFDIKPDVGWCCNCSR